MLSLAAANGKRITISTLCCAPFSRAQDKLTEGSAKRAGLLPVCGIDCEANLPSRYAQLITQRMARLATETQIDPQTAGRANEQGINALRRGDFAAAAADFGDATRADPRAIALWMNLANAYRHLDDTTGERAALDAALSIDRSDFGANLRLAQLLQRIGDVQAALSMWHSAQSLAADRPAQSQVILDEMARGATWCERVQSRIVAEVEATMEAAKSDWGETDHRRISAFVDSAMGRRRIFTNECAGVHYPFLPADEYFDQCHFPWFDRLEASWQAVRAELHKLLRAPGDAIRPYVRMPEGAPPNKWTALDDSLDWSACFLWEYGRPNAALLARCPQTAALLESLPLARIPDRAPNAFFSILRPGSYIPPHTGVTNTRAIIHLALDVPNDCSFRVGGETREWVEGKAFAFDDTIEHEARNDSDQSRSVLIIDTWNPHLRQSEREAIVRYYAAMDGAISA